MRLIKLMLLLLGALTYASSCGMARTGERVTLGDERFEEYVPGLKGKKVAVFSNHTGIVGNRLEDNKMGPHLVDVLIEKGIDVRVTLPNMDSGAMRMLEKGWLAARMRRRV